MKKKEPFLAAILGFLFGGFGLFYISAAQGLTALAVLVVVGVFTGGALVLPIWLGCAVWGYAAAVNFNKEQALSFIDDEEVVEKNFQLPRERQESQNTGESFCIECGNGLRPNAKFCGGCGARVG